VPDAVAVLDASATIVTIWYSGEHLPLPDTWAGDWLHTNTVWVDEHQDLYLSWTGQDTIGKIEGDPASPEFGTLAWTMAGKIGALGSEIAVDWSLVEGDDDVTSSGNALVGCSEGSLREVDAAGTVIRSTTGEFYSASRTESISARSASPGASSAASSHNVRATDSASDCPPSRAAFSASA
jgi:hypothetical protein